MTQLQAARAGVITSQMREVATKEGLDAEFIRQGVAEGVIVIPANINHTTLSAVGIGKGLRTKVNANIGISPDAPDEAENDEKIRVSLDAGADALMDLSIAGDIPGILARVIHDSNVPVGTVPMYQAAADAAKEHRGVIKLTKDELMDCVRKQAIQGVDFMTIHAGLTRRGVERLRNEGRITDIVSRGGSLTTSWMMANKAENPFNEYFDELLAICVEYDVTLSLGDSLRPGCIADATDRAQIEELLTLGELTDRCREAGVQVMIEGPGHVPLHLIETNVLLQKRVCHGAPFYVLGPLVTDVAPGYDHITSAIGGAIAATAGADFLCYVTPAEHLRLPDLADVREGVIAARIAGHAADIAKGVKGAMEWDKAMSRARKALDWEQQINLAIDSIKPNAYRCGHTPKDGLACTMCGEFCAMRISSEALKA